MSRASFSTLRSRASLTNLFAPPAPVTIDGRFYEETLIRRTARGEMLRSKSEVIIANHLAIRNVEYG